MLFNAKLHVAMPGIPSSKETKLRDVEKRFGNMNYGRSLYPEEMIDQMLREKESNSMREDHAQLQSAITTMRNSMPKRSGLRPPPGFDKKDPFYHHVPTNRVPVQSVPHSRHEALRAPVPHSIGYGLKKAPGSNVLEKAPIEGKCIGNNNHLSYQSFFYRCGHRGD